jgi:hypothetical protein
LDSGEEVMAKPVSLRIPEIGFIAGTRAAFGAGLGLLLADKLNRGQRKRVGWVLLTIGAVTTVPIIVNVIRKRGRPTGIAA